MVERRPNADAFRYRLRNPRSTRPPVRSCFGGGATIGGVAEGVGIRTHGGLAPTAVFKTAPLNHLAILPDSPGTPAYGGAGGDPGGSIPEGHRVRRSLPHSPAGGQRTYTSRLCAFGGGDEARKQRVRLERPRLELGVKLHADEPGMISELDRLRQQPVGRHAGEERGPFPRAARDRRY